MKNKISIGKKVLVLRFTRLERMPPAFYETQILRDRGFPIVVYEFGNQRIKPDETLDTSLLRIQPDDSWMNRLPRVSRSFALFLVTLTRLTVALLKDGAPQFIIAHDLMENVLALFIRKAFGIPYVIHSHEIYEKRLASHFNKLLLRFEESAYKQASFLIFPEKERARIYQEKFKLSNPIFIVYNCPRLRQPTVLRTDLRKKYQIPADHKLMLYVGGVSSLNMVLEAVEALKDVPNLAFLIAGWGEASYLEKIKATAQSLGLSERVRLVGFQPDRWEFLEAGDISYCVYGDQELRTKHSITASNKMMESLSSGMAVVIGPQPGSTTFLKQYPVGVSVADFSPTSIARSLNQLVSDETKLSAIGRVGPEAHRSTLNYEKQIEPVLPSFDGLLVDKSALAKVPVEERARRIS